MSEQNERDTFTFVFRLHRFLLHCAIISVGLFLGVLSWYISKPHATKLYETDIEYRKNIKVAPNIDIFLDLNSVVSVKEAQPVQVELFKGVAYFETRSEQSGEMEVKAGKATIRDIGTRFRISLNANGGDSNIMVAEGQVEIEVMSGNYIVRSGEQISFNDMDVFDHQLINETEITTLKY